LSQAERTDQYQRVVIVLWIDARLVGSDREDARCDPSRGCRSRDDLVNANRTLEMRRCRAERVTPNKER
jgi:hypothetical protein